jgi:molybdenum cofactor biosynthesis enzyme MoaA
VSIDTLDPDKFAKITRWGDLARFSTAFVRRRRRA